MYKRLILFFDLRPARLLTYFRQGSKDLWMEIKVNFPQRSDMDKDFIGTNIEGNFATKRKKGLASLT